MAERSPDFVESRLRAETGAAHASSVSWTRLQVRKLTSSLWRTILSLVAFVAIVSLLTGALMRWVFDEFDSYPTAVWWAFEHLIEPSSLALDEGDVRRFFGVVLVVCGHIFLFGILLAILTELVGNSLRNLADVDPPYTHHDHLVVVGWNEGLPDMLAVLVDASQREHTSRDGPLRDIVILAPPELRARRTAIEALLHERVSHVRMALRFGDPTSRPSFDEVAAHAAWAIFITPTLSDGFTPRRADAVMIQIALTVDSYLNQRASDGHNPQVTVSFFWGEDVDAAMSVLPPQFDGLVWDRIWSGWMATGLANLNWARAAEQVIGPNGQNLYLLAPGNLTGEPFNALLGRFVEALPIGVIRAEGEPGRMLTPAPDAPLRADDTLVVLASNLERAREQRATPLPVAAPRAVDLPVAPHERRFTLLVVGANHRVVALLDELSAVRWASFKIIGVSRLSIEERLAMLTSDVRERLNIEFVQALPSDRSRLRQLIDEHQPHAILVTGDWDAYSEENVDAEAILNFLTVKALVGDTIPVQSTTYSPAFANILDAHATNQVITRTGRIVAHTLALSLLRPDLLPLLNTSFDGETHALADPKASWQEGELVRFDEVYQGVLQRGGMLYGFAMPDGELHVNPPRDTLVPSQAHLLIAIERDLQPIPHPTIAGVTTEGNTTS